MLHQGKKVLLGNLDQFFYQCSVNPWQKILWVLIDRVSSDLQFVHIFCVNSILGFTYPLIITSYTGILIFPHFELHFTWNFRFFFYLRVTSYFSILNLSPFKHSLIFWIYLPSETYGDMFLWINRDFLLLCVIIDIIPHIGYQEIISYIGSVFKPLRIITTRIRFLSI